MPRRTRLGNAAGRLAEDRAEHWLQARGLRRLARNYRCRGGEVDLVMLDGETVVFAEVRQRSSARFGSAAESIGERKQTRIVRCARHFLATHAHLDDRPCRFDAVLLSGPLEEATIEWIKDAFQA